MYTEDLEARTVATDKIYLDPNNPRFYTEKTTKDIPDRRITDERVQLNASKEIQRYGIQELRHSILRNGFLPLDRIVVRPIEGTNGAYVVVEGNRRLAALKSLRTDISNGVVDEDNIDDDYLAKLAKATDRIGVLVYQGDIGHDISWILQGVRHISGVREWKPAQRARLIVDQIEDQDLSFSEAGKKFGLTAQAVGRYYRSFKALEQMREDDEYKDKALNEYFSLFEDAIRNRDMRQWLGWSDDDFRFHAVDNLKQFYSWIVPDDEHDADRRIHDPKQIKKLGMLVGDNRHHETLSRFDNYDITIEQAHDAALGSATFDWQTAISKAIALIGGIPQGAIADDKDAILGDLKNLEKCIKNLKAMATAI